MLRCSLFRVGCAAVGSFNMRTPCVSLRLAIRTFQRGHETTALFRLCVGVRPMRSSLVLVVAIYSSFVWLGPVDFVLPCDHEHVM